MKVRLVFKTPDVLEEFVSEQTPTPEELEKAKEVISKFIKLNEYVTIEIDTDLDYCIVLPVNK